MTEEKLVQGNTYLIKWGNSGTIVRATVLMVTGKAYQFIYENGNTTWIEIREFERDSTVVENISDFMVKELQKNFDGTFTFTESLAVEYETCPVCHGTGNVPNSQTTAAFVTCPLCQGNRRVVKRTEVKQ